MRSHWLHVCSSLGLCASKLSEFEFELWLLSHALLLHARLGLGNVTEHSESTSKKFAPRVTASAEMRHFAMAAVAIASLVSRVIACAHHFVTVAQSFGDISDASGEYVISARVKSSGVHVTVNVLLSIATLTLQLHVRVKSTQTWNVFGVQMHSAVYGCRLMCSFSEFSAFKRLLLSKSQSRLQILPSWMYLMLVPSFSVAYGRWVFLSML